MKVRTDDLMLSFGLLEFFDNNQNSVIKGGLASYSANRYEVGRLSAKYVQRILGGVKPQDLPVEGVRKMDLVIN